MIYSALHLRPGAREWYLQWVAREHPELVERYASMYATSSYAPKDYRAWLRAKMEPIVRRSGLARTLTEPSTGTVRSAARGRRTEGGLVARELPPSLAQPMLF